MIAAVTGSSDSSSAKPRPVESPQSHLIERVGDHARAEPDRHARGQQVELLEGVDRRRHPHRCDHNRAGHHRHRQPVDAQAAVGDASAEHDVARPQRGGDQDEPDPRHAAPGLRVGEQDDATGGQHERQPVVAGARPCCRNRDRPDELDRDRRAQRHAIDRQIEGQVHQRQRGSERDHQRQVGPRQPGAPGLPPHRQRGGRADHPQPGHPGSRHRLEQQHRQRGTDVLRDRARHEQRLRRDAGQPLASGLDHRRSLRGGRAWTG